MSNLIFHMARYVTKPESRLFPCKNSHTLHNVKSNHRKNTFIDLVISFAALLFSLIACDPAGPSKDENDITVEEGLDFTSPQKVGMDSVQFARLTAAINTGEYPNVHSVLIARNGKLVYEKYFAGRDEILGHSMGMISHHKDTLHDIRSVTKSIVSACIGIALSHGEIRSVDENIWAYFPEYLKFKQGEKAALTIKHLLTMTSGLEWNENIPYTDPANSEIQMDQSTDPIQFVLSRKLIHRPGGVWNYNGGTTQVLAAIIKKTTGMEVDKYADKYLFSPLGIIKYYWIKFRDSGTQKEVPLAAAGLRLRSRDLLKFGLLYMNKGVWNGKRILPENWVLDSHRSHITRENPIAGKGGYGYQFWTWNEPVRNKTIALAVAVGNGDQRIFFDHENNLLVVTTAGNYNNWTIRNNAAALLKNFIYSSLDKAKR